MIHLELDRTENAIPRATAWLALFCADHGLSRETELDFRLALDELLSNTIRHGYASSETGRIELSLSITPEAVRLELRDWAAPFDPLAAPSPDLTTPAERRQVGGLGIHFVRDRMDRIQYSYEDGANRLVLERSV